MDDYLDKFPLSLPLDDTAVASSESVSVVSEASDLDKPSDDDTSTTLTSSESAQLTIQGMHLTLRVIIAYVKHEGRLCQSHWYTAISKQTLRVILIIFMNLTLFCIELLVIQGACAAIQISTRLFPLLITYIEVPITFIFP